MFLESSLVVYQHSYLKNNYIFHNYVKIIQVRVLVPLCSDVIFID